MSAEPASRRSAPFAIDLRSLAVCRILTGLTVVGDLLSRAWELRLHYTAQGIYPVSHLLETERAPFPGIYLVCDQAWAVALLFLVHGLIALALMAGYRTTLVTVLCWYFQRSLQARNFLILNGGDMILMSVLFWAMFLPWGRRWSLDALLGGEPDTAPDEKVSTLAAGLFTLQLPFIYWLSVAHKFEPTWMRGEAVYYALRSTFYARSTGQVLLAHPDLLRLMTYGTLVWELLAPALLFAPWPRIRTFTVLALACMHASFAAFLRIGIFGWTPCLYLVIFVPAELWQRLANRLAQLGASLLARARGLSWPLGSPHRYPAEARWPLIFLAVYSVFYGISQDPRLPRFIPDSLSWVQGWTGVMQRWSVFVNLPNLNDGWVVLEAKLENGKTADIFQGNDPVDWSQPEVLSKLHGHFRWPTPLVVIVGEPSLQADFMSAMRGDWERRGGSRVLECRLIFMKKSFLGDYQDGPPQRRVVREWKASP